MADVEKNQQDLLSKLEAGEKKLGKKKEGKEDYYYYESVYKQQVDAFQALATDNALAINESPTAKKHFDTGSEKVNNILIQAAIQGATLSGDLKSSVKQDAAEKIYSMAGELSEHMKPYREDLKEIATTEIAVNSVKKYQSDLMIRFGEMLTSKSSLSEDDLSKARNGNFNCGKAKMYLESFTKLPPEFKRINLEYVNSQITFFTSFLSFHSMQEIVDGNEWDKYVEITMLPATGDIITEKTAAFYALPKEEQYNIINKLGLARIKSENESIVTTAPPIMKNYFEGITLFHQGDLQGAKTKLEQFLAKDVWSAELARHPEYFEKRFILNEEGKKTLKQIDESLKKGPVLIMKNYQMGIALLEQGRLEDAKKYLEDFYKKDIWSKEMEKQKDYWAKRYEMSKEGEKLLKEIDAQLAKNRDFFDGQRYANSGDIVTAKIILVKFVGANSSVKAAETKKLVKAANVLLRQIARIQLAELKQKFDDLPVPEGTFYKDEEQRFQELGRLIESSDAPDLTAIIASRYPELAKGHLLLDLSIEEKNKRDRPDAKTQFAGLKKRFEEMPVPPRYFTGPGRADLEKNETPEYLQYKKLQVQMMQLEQMVETYENIDLEAIINGNFPDLKPGHLFLLTLAEDSEKGGLLELARKYREMGKPAIAREYYKKYFASRLGKVAKEKVTVEKVRQDYVEKIPFRIEVQKKLDEVVGHYKELYGNDWESMYKRAGGEERIRLEIENQAVNQIYLREVMKFQHDNVSDISAVDLPIWNEFAEMEGIKARSVVGIETVAISDEELKRLIEEITVAIIITAVSAGVASVAAGVVSRGIVMAAGRVGMSHGATVFASRAGGFAAESLIFSSTSVSLNAIKAGNLSLNTFGEGVTGEIAHGTAVLGMFKGIGFLGKAFGAGSTISARAAAGTGKGAKAAKGLVYAHGLTTEMIGMGIVEGMLTPEAAAMVLGLRMAHSKSAQKFNEKMAIKKAEALEALRSGKARSRGVTGPETAMLREGVKHDMESIGVNGSADVRNVVIGRDGTIAINGRKTLSPAEFQFLSEALKQRINEVAMINSLDTHHRSIFANAEEMFEGDLKTPAKIDADGRIYFNVDYYNNSVKFQNLGFKLERSADGRNVFKVNGKEYTADQFFGAEDVPSGQMAAVRQARKALLEAMGVDKTHEVLHRLVGYAFKDDPDELVNEMKDILGDKTGIEWTLKNAEELVAMIGETAPRPGQSVEIEWGGKVVRLSTAQVGRLEAFIKNKFASGKVKLPREFSFRGSRGLDTLLLARELPGVFARGEPAYRTPHSDIDAIDAGWTTEPAKSAKRVNTLDELNSALRAEVNLELTAKNFENIVRHFMSVIRTGDPKAIEAFIKRYESQINRSLLLKLHQEYAIRVSDVAAFMSSDERVKRFHTLYADGKISQVELLIFQRMLAEQKAIERLTSSRNNFGNPKSPEEKAKDLVTLRKMISSKAIDLNDNAVRVLTEAFGKSLNEGKTHEFDSMQLPETIKKRIILNVVKSKYPEISDLINMLQAEVDLPGSDIMILLNLPENLSEVILKSGLYRELKLSPKELVTYLSILDARDIEIIENNARELNPSQVQSILTTSYESFDGGRIRVYKEAVVGVGGSAEVTAGLCHIEGIPKLLDVVLKVPHEGNEAAIKNVKDEALKAARFSQLQQQDPRLRDSFMKTIWTGESIIIYERVGGREGAIPADQALDTVVAGPNGQYCSDKDFSVMVGQSVIDLSIAHEQGIVHRDVKPDNIMITKQGGVWIDHGSQMTAAESHSVQYVYVLNNGANSSEIPADVPTHQLKAYLRSKNADVAYYRDNAGILHEVDGENPLPPNTPTENLVFRLMPKSTTVNGTTFGGVTEGYFDPIISIAAHRNEIPHTKEDYPALAETLTGLFITGVNIFENRVWVRHAPPRVLPPAAQKQLYIYLDALRHPDRPMDPNDPNSKPVDAKEVGKWLTTVYP